MGNPVRSCPLHCAPPTTCWRDSPSPDGGVIEQDEGRTIKTPLPTLHTHITYAKPAIREQTAYYYSYKKHIIPGIGNVKLNKLMTLQIQQFYNKPKTSGRVQRYEYIEPKGKELSNRFIRGIHGVLNSALGQAVKERLITSDPAEGRKLPRIEKKEIKVLRPEQIGTYLQEANKHGLLLAYYLQLTSGLQRGKLLTLLWINLDVENMTIFVTTQMNRITNTINIK